MCVLMLASMTFPLMDYHVRRLLDSRDSKTNNATLHLINNVTRNSPSRMYVTSPLNLPRPP